MTTPPTNTPSETPRTIEVFNRIRQNCLSHLEAREQLANLCLEIECSLTLANQEIAELKSEALASCNNEKALQDQIAELKKDKDRLQDFIHEVIIDIPCDEFEPDCLACRAVKLLEETGCKVTREWKPKPDTAMTRKEGE